jgi:iron-sulfur cluster repair protein YtfE (RIC family)
MISIISKTDSVHFLSLIPCRLLFQRLIYRLFFKMETTDTTIEHVESWLEYLETVQHEKLLDTADSIETDLKKINKAERKNSEMLDDLITRFKEVKNDVEEMIQKEQHEIFTQIREALENSDAKVANKEYHNLPSPVRSLIMEHHKILDKIEALLPVVTALGYKGLTGNEHMKTYIDLYDFYNAYNKVIYIEENMLFPALVAIFERKSE